MRSQGCSFAKFSGGTIKPARTGKATGLPGVLVRLQRVCRHHFGADGEVGMDAPGLVGESDVHRVALGPAFLDHGLQAAGGQGDGADGRGDAHGGAVGGIDPGVVGDGVGRGQGRLAGQVLFEDAAVEGLLQAVGGDEAEAFDLARNGRGRRRGATRTRRNRRIGHRRRAAQGLGVAVARAARMVLAPMKGLPMT